ncbi:MAG: DUF2442 domain-containing protein [Sulfuritalea sp.]|nr:DUF2442 domain-containing protein [Sulfuritalea sp.]MDP1981223.1 DUF2442 domain-containing protein [Sulfuritalea sp.]
MSKHLNPELLEVMALEPYRLCTRWSTGEVLEVDVGDKLRGIPIFAKILDPAVFAKAHVTEGGGSVEWFDAEFGADKVYTWAKQRTDEPDSEVPGNRTQDKCSEQIAAAGYGLVKPKLVGKPRRLADFDAASVATRNKPRDN